MRNFLFFTLILALTGCGTFHKSAPAQAPASQRWFLDPSVEFSNYRTFGFLQATAIRYEEPVLENKKHGLFGKRPDTYEERRKAARHTDELIWRVLRDEMQMKGYVQVQPNDADILVIYYGGPRPQLPPMNLTLNPHPFDSYFARNELQAQTFWVDIIDNKRNSLIFRGWDNAAFVKNDPAPEMTIAATKQAIGFFPTRR